MGLSVMGAGALGNAAGSYFSASAQKSALNSQADIAAINARQAELAAQQELARGQSQVAQITSRAGQIKGAQRASAAANGVDLGSESVVEQLTSTDLAKEVDMNQATANAVSAAWGYRKQGTGYKNQALADRASSSSISPGIAATSSLLGSATSIATSWYAGQKANSGASGATSASGGFWNSFGKKGE